MYKDNLTLFDLIDRIRTGYGWGDIGKRVSTKSEPPDSSARKAVILAGPLEPRGSEGCVFNPKIKHPRQQTMRRGFWTSCAFFHQCDLARLYCINNDIKKGKVLPLSQYVHLYFVIHEGKLTTGCQDGFAPKGKFSRNKL